MDLLNFLSLFYQDPKSYLLCLILIGLYKHDRCINRIEGYIKGFKK